MDENSKDAEIRARVSPDMHKELAAIAHSRGEKLPVILREAVTEYLAKRITGHTGKYPAPGTTALLHTLQEQPEVANTLIALGRLLSASPAAVPPPDGSYGGGKKPRRKPSK